MRPTVGIICEYDPFHRGHARQFALIREALPQARIVCVMSACFTQRGSPALFSPAFRARAALAAGASLVLELPCAFAVREAEHFALGGVAALSALGFVTHLSFGCEDGDLHRLQAAAALLEAPTPAFRDALRAALAQGLPFAAAQARAVAAALAQPAQRLQACSTGTGSASANGADAGSASVNGADVHGVFARDTSVSGACAIGADTHGTDTRGANAHGAAACSQASPLNDAQGIAALLARPNNILGVCYLRAIARLRSPLAPLPVRREGAYHAQSLAEAGYPSATATRNAYLAGDLPAAEAACGYGLGTAICHKPQALDAVLLHTLRALPPQALRALPDCTEGLENRLARAAREASGREALLALLKTRRYPRARLSRLLSHALLGVTGELLASHPLPEHIRLLGFRQDDRACLALLSGSGVPIVAKAADGDRQSPLHRLDERAYDLWALGTGLPAGLMYTQGVEIV